MAKLCRGLGPCYEHWIFVPAIKEVFGELWEQTPSLLKTFLVVAEEQTVEGEGGRGRTVRRQESGGLQWVMVGEAVRRSLASFEGKAERTC